MTAIARSSKIVNSWLTRPSPLTVEKNMHAIELGERNEGRSERVLFLRSRTPQVSIFFSNDRKGQALRVTRSKGEGSLTRTK